MFRIHVVFRKSDVDAARAVMRPEDVAFGDVNLDDVPGRGVIPTVDAEGTRGLARRTWELFTGLAGELGESVSSFANLFFESSVLPLASYATGLAALIEEHRARGARVEVWFPRRLRFAVRSSTFFLAEHETQGRLLYRRSHVFQPYLVDLSSRLGADVRYHSGSELSLVSLVGAPRRWLAWGLRLGFAVAKCLAGGRARRRGSPVDPSPAPTLVALTRIPTKSEYLRPILTHESIEAQLVVAENFLNFRRNARFSERLYRSTRVRRVSLIAGSLPGVIVTYLNGARRSLAFRRRVELDIGPVRINLSSAVAEMLVSYPDLLLYESALQRTLSTLPAPTAKLLLSTEQKSPYASADARVARRLGWRCYHMMEADQSDRPLPRPVAGDLFVTESRKALESFRASWIDDRSRLAFMGSLRGAAAADAAAPAPGSETRWCFFSSADPRKDARIVEALLALRRSTNLDFLIKLHPRDAEVRYRKWSGLEVVADGTMPKQELYARFGFALAFHSAVVADLFWFDKPFLLLDIEEEAYFNDKVHQTYADLLVPTTGELGARMRDTAALRTAYQRYRESFMRESGGIVSPGRIVEQLVAHRAGAA